MSGVGRGVLLLSIDTSTQSGSVALGRGGTVLGEASVQQGKHSSVLLPMVDFVMRAVGAGPEDLGGVVVGAGPGSFTGTRIAAATAKGIVHGRGIPLYAYSSLLAAAVGSWTTDRPVCAMVDARNRDVFAAVYRFGEKIEEVLEPIAIPLDELLARLDDSVAFVGEGATLHREEISSKFGEGCVVPEALNRSRAGGLLWLAHAHASEGTVEDPHRWEPVYGRPSGAERIAAARGAGGPAA